MAGCHWGRSTFVGCIYDTNADTPRFTRRVMCLQSTIRTLEGLHHSLQSPHLKSQCLHHNNRQKCQCNQSAALLVQQNLENIGVRLVSRPLNGPSLDYGSCPDSPTYFNVDIGLFLLNWFATRLIIYILYSGICLFAPPVACVWVDCICVYWNPIQLDSIVNKPLFAYVSASDTNNLNCNKLYRQLALHMCMIYMFLV